MTTRIQNLSDLQDRRIMMEKKLPALPMRFGLMKQRFMNR